MRALIVDDSAVIRTVMARILKTLGYEVVQARDGEEALRALELGSAPEVALIDWNMPVMDGLEFVRRVRARDDWRALRLMIVTTETELEQVREALAIGADEYLMKPFTVAMVREKLELLGLGAR